LFVHRNLRRIKDILSFHDSVKNKAFENPMPIILTFERRK
jgi:hypothetical protein